jgi:hypothetical protein
MRPHEPQVILHGGFHKTGTTHLQRILKRNSGYLARQGVTYVHHRDTRKQLTVPVQLNGYLHLGIQRRRKIDDISLREMTEKFFRQQVGKRTRRLLISDENLPGHCGQCVRGGELYSLRRQFAGTFAREIPYEVAELHLAIRNHADFFAAAYVEFLRSLKRDSASRRFVTEDEMKQGVMQRMPAWFDAISDIKSAFPKTKIVLWRFEEFSELSDRVLANLCGDDVDISKFKKPSADRARPTASGRAVGRLLQIHDRKGLAALVDKRIEIQEAFPTGAKWPRYDPWTPEERSELDAHYRKDWDRIRASGAFHILDREVEVVD